MKVSGLLQKGEAFFLRTTQKEHVTGTSSMAVFLHCVYFGLNQGESYSTRRGPGSGLMFSDAGPE
jgi:hypothetical protein